MMLAMDVLYNEAQSTARVAGILFEDWSSPTITSSHTKTVPNVAPYEPGFFYKRELPCLLSLLQDLPDPVSLIVVDGYVAINPEHPGLGQYLYDALGQTIPVVGVAKTPFRGSIASHVYRGDSKNPLFVTSMGVSLSTACEGVAAMCGSFRIPHLLKLVDQLTRQ